MVAVAATLAAATGASTQTTDTLAPVATIDSGPVGQTVNLPDGSNRNLVDSNEATFTFHAETALPEGPTEEPDATFECKLLSGEEATSVVSGEVAEADVGSYEPCTSPQTYTDLPEGQQLFLVRAIDVEGNIGDPAGWNWYIDLPDSLPVPTTEEQCKNGGYEDFGFRNQGQCISSLHKEIEE